MIKKYLTTNRLVADLTVILCMMVLTSVCAQAENMEFQKHTVQKGETLGSILQSYDISPLWGPKGNVLKTIQLNPNIISDAGDLPEPGTQILIPKSKLETKVLDQRLEVAEVLQKQINIEEKEKVSPEVDYKSDDHSVKNEFYILHTVRKRETLGSILQSYDISPLWGPKGNVVKTIDINSNNPDFDPADLKDGLVIKIPKKMNLEQLGTELQTLSDQKPTSEIPVPALVQYLPQVGLEGFGDIDEQQKTQEVISTLKVEESKDIALDRVEKNKSISRKVEMDMKYGYFEYEVEKGDTIGSILEKFNITPLWGPKGNVIKATEMNQNNPNFKVSNLSKGSKIRLPVPEKSKWDDELQIFLYEYKPIQNILAENEIEKKSQAFVEDKKIDRSIAEDSLDTSFKTSAESMGKGLLSEADVTVALKSRDRIQVDPNKSFFEYTVQSGETLGNILQNFNIVPLWGPKGHVIKTTELNQNNPDFKVTDLKRGMKILLPIPRNAYWDEEVEMFFHSQTEGLAQKSAVEQNRTLSSESIGVISESKETLIPEKIMSSHTEDITQSELHQDNYDIKSFYLEREREYGPLKLRPGEEDTGVRTGNSTYFWYRIKRGETISEILYTYKVKPLWGSNGFVQITTRINDGKVKKSGDSVAEGEWIRVPIPNGEWERPVVMVGPTEPEVLSIEDDIPQIPPILVPKSSKKQESVVCEPPTKREIAALQYPEWLAPDIIEKLKDYERLKRIPQAIEVQLQPREAKYGTIAVDVMNRFTRWEMSQAGNTSKAVVNSDIDSELEAKWTKNFSERWDIALGYRYRYLKFKAPDDRPLLIEKNAYHTYYLEGIYNHSPKLRSQYSLGYVARPYLRSITQDDVSLVQISSPYLGANLKYDLFFHGPTYLSLELGGRAIFAGSSESVSSKTGFEVHAQIEQKIFISQDHAIGFSVKTEYLSGSTDATEQNGSAFGIGINWMWTP